MTNQATPTLYSIWRHRVQVHVRATAEHPDAVDEITAQCVAAELSGKPSSVWHECHRYYLRHMGELPTCSICGARAPARDLQPEYLGPGARAHALCRARQRHGLPTPPVLYVPTCPCMQCSKAVAK